MEYQPIKLEAKDLQRATDAFKGFIADQVPFKVHLYGMLSVWKKVLSVSAVRE